MPRTNPQSRNVGNLGDILKHAALVEIASLLASAGAAVRFVDTHTYLLHAPLADGPRWNHEVDDLAAAHAAYGRYAALERASLAHSKRYRCSSGLVIDVLGLRRGVTTLGEADATTRAELREQIGGEHLPDVTIAHDAVSALSAPPTSTSASSAADGALLVHIDPFALSPTLWASLAPALDAACARAATAAVLAYRYTRGARSAWPKAPVGTFGPVAQTRGGPHEVAVYASPSIVNDVSDACGRLGWNLAQRDL